jgi:competence CoiA-like predicted nuclease
MLTAIRKSDNIKVIGNFIAKDNTEEYFCEYCGKSLVHHRSDSKIKFGHFKHKQGESDCPNQIKESEYHFKTKLDIYNYIKSGWGKKLKILELEKWICNKTIRSDIYIETNKNKIAIEVQATILNVSEIKRRTQKYCKNNIYVLWILPFEFNKIWVYKPFEILSNGIVKTDYYLDRADRCKMKEMEIFLYWTYFKKLIYWDLEHEHSDSFICVGFSEYQSDSVDFWKDGEEHSYSERTAKTIKSVQWVEESLKFTDFRTKFAKEFKAPFRDYVIPERKLFTIDR